MASPRKLHTRKPSIPSSTYHVVDGRNTCTATSPTSSQHSPVTPRSPPNFSRRNLTFDESRRGSANGSAGFGTPPRSPVTMNGATGLGLHSPVVFRDNSMEEEMLARQISQQHDAGTNGLGNLADELAEAWEGDEEDEEDEEVDLNFANPTNVQNGFGSPESNYRRESNGYAAEGIDIHDLGIQGSGLGTSRALQDALSQSPAKHNSTLSTGNSMLSPPKPATNKKILAHRRHESQYDGSDYGNDSDLEETGGFTPGLEARMAGIDSLARRGTEANGSSADLVVQRTVALLRDLGGQSGIENGATRLITAHTSVTSHLTHQTRTLQNLTHQLLLPQFHTAQTPLSTDDELLPLINDLIPLLPYPPTPTPLTHLSTLLSQTTDLIHTVRSLNDTLHESRQLTSTASRRLKAAKEIVSEIRRDEEEREEGERWIEKGAWDRRLREREAERVCGEVVGGFESVWEGWRERLFGEEGRTVEGAVA